MIQKYLGYEQGRDLFSFRIPGITGDGIRMAWEAGAGKSEMSLELILGIPDVSDASVSIPWRQPSAVIVNLQGERFMPEELIQNTPFTANAISRQKNRFSLSIIDSGIIKHFQRKGFDIVHGVFSGSLSKEFEQDIQSLIDGGNHSFFIAESLEDLAEKSGVNADGLIKTIEEYNRGCENKEDEFNKSIRYLRPIRGAKYFGMKLFPGAYGTLGGIKVNHNMEVLTDDFEVIPGFYAAGTDTCSIYGDTYPFVLPGNTMGYALNSGRIAGENAAEFVNY